MWVKKAVVILVTNVTADEILKKVKKNLRVAFALLRSDRDKGGRCKHSN